MQHECSLRKHYGSLRIANEQPVNIQRGAGKDCAIVGYSKAKCNTVQPTKGTQKRDGKEERENICEVHFGPFTYTSYKGYASHDRASHD